MSRYLISSIDKVAFVSEQERSVSLFYCVAGDSQGLRVAFEIVADGNIPLRAHISLQARGRGISGELEMRPVHEVPGDVLASLVERAEKRVDFVRSFGCINDSKCIVDQYQGDNRGLIIVERVGGGLFRWQADDGFEITSDRRFDNEMLAFNPVKNWRTEFEDEFGVLEQQG